MKLPPAICLLFFEADKYQQIFSSVNPVASSHFNFSVLEPMGVVGAFSPENGGLTGIISSIIPAITGGNSVIVFAAPQLSTAAICFAEILNNSDLPGGVINILTGKQDELIKHFSTHMDVNAVVCCDFEDELIAEIKDDATLNLKRVITYNYRDWNKDECQSPYFINDCQETKTTWHPIGAGMSGAGGNY